VKRRAAVLLATVAVALSATATPARADGIRDSQWHLRFLDVAGAHRLSEGAGVVVAVVDSGVDPSHPDLVGSVLPPLLAPGVAVPSDVDGRGTGLAGLIVGHGHPATTSTGTSGPDGVLGVAPKARVLPVVITSRPGQFGDPDVLADGIDLAVAGGARVICVGRGLPATPRLEQAVAAALASGAVVVAPMANRRGESFLPWPASYPGVVGATPLDRTGALFPSPSVGSTPVSSATPGATALPAPSSPPGKDVAAPGTDLVTTDSGGGYRIDAGTGAAALVAGVAALVRARFPDLPATEVIRRLGNERGVLDPVGALTRAVARPAPSASSTAGPRVLPGPPLTAAPVATVAAPAVGPAAFDTGDWRRWLVALPLLAFLAALLIFAFGGRRRGAG